MSSIISLKNISKHYTENHKRLLVLENVNLEVRTGEFLVLVGPSGCGKSTLLRIMSGLEKDFAGELSLAEGLRSSDMSFVFQQFALLPWLTVFQNIELGLLSKELAITHRHEIVHNELKQFGLEKFTKSYPRDLSGGMRQRVGIARALATNPKVIFMDESFSELDSFTAAELRSDLLEIWTQRGPTVIMVTHIISEALELADRVGILTSRPGRIEKIIENKLPRPRRQRSEDFFRLEDELLSLIKP